MNTIQIVRDMIGAAEEIESELLATLRRQQRQSVNCNFSLSAMDGGRRIGGLTAATSYGWLLVKTLWVQEDCQKTGIGSALLTHAEELGTEQGCHGVWLDTSSSDAREFYIRFGYRDFGMLENRDDQYPAEHRRWFMQKPL